MIHKLLLVALGFSLVYLLVNPEGRITKIFSGSPSVRKEEASSKMAAEALISQAETQEEAVPPAAKALRREQAFAKPCVRFPEEIKNIPQETREDPETAKDEVPAPEEPQPVPVAPPVVIPEKTTGLSLPIKERKGRFTPEEIDEITSTLVRSLANLRN